MTIRRRSTSSRSPTSARPTKKRSPSKASRSGGSPPGAALPDGVPSEHVEQREFVSAFRKRHPDVRIFAIPNGEARSRTTGARLKAEGVSAGVPDLFIPAWLVWIEMKRQRGGVVSPAQRDWHRYLESLGHIVIVARGQEEAWRLLGKIDR